MDRSIALRIFAIAVLCCTSIQASGLDFEESDMQIEAKSHSSSSVFVPADGVHRRVKRSGDGVVDTTKDGATFDERLLTIRWHNDYRSDVSPTATNMQHMTWDTDLAGWAQEWAEGCVWGHGQPAGAPSPLGQNLYIVTGGYNITWAIEAWYDEVADYTYASKACSDVCGHYTQVVWHNSDTVGCAIKFCPTTDGFAADNAYYMVCNYRPTGNYNGEFPYESGTSCSNCPADKPTCEENLCRSDPLCGSVTCADDQVLMTDTCECGDGDGGDGDGGDGDGDGGDGDGDGDDEDGGSITSASMSTVGALVITSLFLLR